MNELKNPKFNDKWQKVITDLNLKASPTNEEIKLIFVGDDLCGKSSLVSLITNSELDERNKGLVLNYTYTSIKSHQTENESQYSIWTLNYYDNSFSLLSNIVELEDIIQSRVIFLITFDLSKPFLSIETLEKWVGLISDFLSNFELTDDQKKSVSLNYAERLKMRNNSSKEIESSHLIIKENFNPNDVFHKDLFIPMIAVGCKSDKFRDVPTYLKSWVDSTMILLIFLRRWCLDHKMALIYTSTKNKNGIDALKQYLNLLAFQIPIKNIEFKNEVESVLIPFGWDSQEKIDLLIENLQDSLHQNLSDYFEITREKDSYHHTLQVEPSDTEKFINFLEEDIKVKSSFAPNNDKK